MSGALNQVTTQHEARLEPTALPGVWIVEPQRHLDDRGYFAEVYRREWVEPLGITFVQDNHSLSISPGTVRGLHYQAEPQAQDKLVRVVHGAITDVAVDVRPGSRTFGQHVIVTLSQANGRQLLIPRGFAHGFCTLEPNTEVAYKVSAYYSREHDRGIRWNDPALRITWPVGPDQAVVSPRDAAHPTWAEYCAGATIAA